MIKMASEPFKHMMESDPLFSAEGMDLERGEAVLDGIELLTRNIETRMGKNSLLRRMFFTRYPIARYALPVPFVRDFIKSEQSRRRFLADPSEENGTLLVQAWEKAQLSFAQCVKRYRILHQLLFRLDTEAKHPIQDVLGNVITPEDVWSHMQLLERNSVELQRAVELRRALLRGQNVSNTLSTGTSDKLRYVPTHISSTHAHLHDMDRAHCLPFRHGKVIESFGPLSYALKNFDGERTSHVFSAYVVRNHSGLISLRVSSLDVYRFIKITGPDARFPHIGQAAFIDLIRAGLPYWYQSVTSLYTMRDQQYWADIATIFDCDRRPDLDLELVQAQKSSLLHLLLGACLEDHEIYLENVELRKGYWYWLLFRTHPSIYYLPFNKSVWRLGEKVNFLGSGRAEPEQILYKSADVLLKELTSEEIERVMHGGRIRADARTTALNTS